MPGAGTRVRVGYFVPPSPHFAGMERVVHEIATGLVEGHAEVLDVHVLYSTTYDEVLRDARYTLHLLEVDRLRHLVGTLRSFVAELDLDILVCPQVEPSVTAWLATRGLRLPVFVPHLHGNPRVEESEGSRRTKLAFSMFRHVVSRRIPGVLAVSPSLQRYAAEFIARNTQVYFSKNPVRRLAEPTSPSPEDNRFHFVNVARLFRQKGQDVLLRALAIARPELPPVRLTLVGSGPEESTLRRLSTELGLDDVVVFAGSVSEPAGYLRSADCFVLPSRWEGFGLVLIEALQFGLPLLAADCDFGPSDIITDPRLGELVPPESPEALADGMKRAASRVPNDGDRAIRLASASNYGRREATLMHLAVLKEIVARRSGSSDRLKSLSGA